MRSTRPRTSRWAAAEAGVRCIVYLSRLLPATSADDAFFARREVGDALRAGTVQVIELRAGLIIGPGSGAFEILLDLVLKLPVMVTPRWVHKPSPPIALPNLLEYLIRLPQLPAAYGRTFEAGGPRQLTYADMMRTLARVLGRRAPLITPAHVATPRLSARWLWLVTAVPWFSCCLRSCDLDGPAGVSRRGIVRPCHQSIPRAAA